MVTYQHLTSWARARRGRQLTGPGWLATQLASHELMARHTAARTALVSGHASVASRPASKASLRQCRGQCGCWCAARAADAPAGGGL
jgi:hypothetical protein